MMTDDETLARIFAALASSSRLALMRELAVDDGSVKTISHLAARTELARLTASHHLAILRRSGLVTSVRVGTSTPHSISPEVLSKLDDWLYPLLGSDLVLNVAGGANSADEPSWLAA